MFDENGDGMISIEELEGMMAKLGDKPEPAELKKMMDSVDTDGKYILTILQCKLEVSRTSFPRQTSLYIRRLG